MDKKLKKRSGGTDKKLKSLDVFSYKTEYFNWSINTGYLYEETGDFSLFCSLGEFFKIIKKLDSYRTWTWSDIERSRNGSSTGVMDISRLDTRELFEKHLTSLKKENIDQLYKIEINNHHRVWGIREGSCLFLIWNDPNHSFYKHKNKNYTEKKR